jgi:hypothetical protein
MGVIQLVLKISFLLNPLSKEGTCKVRNEIKQNETKRNVTSFRLISIIWSHWNFNLICILWYQTTVQNLKSVLKLYLETIGGGQKRRFVWFRFDRFSFISFDFVRFRFLSISFCTLQVPDISCSLRESHVDRDHYKLNLSTWWNSWLSTL